MSGPNTRSITATIFGVYILDKNQQPISNQNVQVFDGSKLLGENKTDSAGYYSLHLHLHNSDKARKLRLFSGSNEA